MEKKLMPTLGKNAIAIFLTVLAVMTSGYALTTVPQYNIYYLLLLVVPILLFVFVLKNPHFAELSIHWITVLTLLLLIPIVIACLRDSSNISSSIKFLSVVVFALLIVHFYTFEEFQHWFLVVMRVVVIAALVLHVAINYLHITPPLPKVMNTNDTEYYNGWIVFALTGYTAGRNPGCFWEPGIFASFLSIGLVFIVMSEKKISVWDVILFTLALFSTLSTAGYFLIILVLLMAVFKNVKFSAKGVLLLCVLLVAALALFLYSDTLIQQLVEWKPRVFSKLITDNASKNFRLESPITNLKVFFSNPLFGEGLAGAGNAYIGISNISQTSTSTFMGAAFGILGLLFTIVGTGSILFYKKWNVLCRVLFLIIFLFILNKEPHTYFTVSYIIMFYFVEAATQKRKQEKTGSAVVQ